MATATLDPFLFELLDLLQLAFPRTVQQATVVFGGPPGERRALVDLTAEAAPDAIARPDLGYPDAEVLDTLNAVVGDLTAALATDHADISTLASGQIVFAPGDSGSIVAEVREGERLLMKRLIDRSEQYHLIHTPGLFAELALTAEEEERAQARLADRIGERTRFTLDVDHNLLTLGDDVTFSATLLSTWHPESRTFMWGWANEGFPAPFRQRVDEVRQGATGFGLRALATAELLCPEKMAHRLAQHAATKLGCVGTWRWPMETPGGQLFIWLGVFERDDEAGSEPS